MFLETTVAKNDWLKIIFSPAAGMFFPMTSQPSFKACDNRTSTLPPEDFLPIKRAGMTLELFKTKTSPGFK